MHDYTGGHYVKFFKSGFIARSFFIAILRKRPGQYPIF